MLRLMDKYKEWMNDKKKKKKPKFQSQLIFLNFDLEETLFLQAFYLSVWWI